jgi:hypothetical protein
MKKDCAHITKGYVNTAARILKGYAPLNAIHWQAPRPVPMLANAVRAR